MSPIQITGIVSHLNGTWLKQIVTGPGLLKKKKSFYNVIQFTDGMPTCIDLYLPFINIYDLMSYMTMFSY